MKKALFLTLILFLVFIFTATAQILKPVKWSFNAIKITDAEFDLVLKADIDKGWHVYSTDTVVNGPIPTSFKFQPSGEYELVGKIKTSKVINEYDKVLEMQLRYFEHEAIFKQRVKMKSDKPFQIAGELEFMACNDRSCLPPDVVEFSFNLPGIDKSGKEGNKDNQVAEQSSTVVKIKAPTAARGMLQRGVAEIPGPIQTRPLPGSNLNQWFLLLPRHQKPLKIRKMKIEFLSGLSFLLPSGSDLSASLHLVFTL